MNRATAFWISATIVLMCSSCISADYHEYKDALAGHLFSEYVNYGGRFGCNSSRIHVLDSITRKLPLWLTLEENEGILHGVPQESDLGTYDVLIIGIRLVDGFQEVLCKQFVWTITVVLEPKSLPVGLISYISNETNIISGGKKHRLSKCLSDSRLTLVTISFTATSARYSDIFARLIKSINKFLLLPTGLIQIMDSANPVIFFKQLQKLRILRFEQIDNFHPVTKEFSISWPLGCERDDSNSFNVHEVHKRSISTLPELQMTSWHVTSGEVGTNLIRRRRGIFFGSITAIEGTPAVTSTLPSRLVSSVVYTSVGSVADTKTFTLEATSPIASSLINVEPSSIISGISSYFSVVRTTGGSEKFVTASLESDVSSSVERGHVISSSILQASTIQYSTPVLSTLPSTMLTKTAAETTSTTSIVLSSGEFTYSSSKLSSTASFVGDRSVCSEASCHGTSLILQTTSLRVLESSHSFLSTRRMSTLGPSSQVYESTVKSAISSFSSVDITRSYSSVPTEMSSNTERTTVGSSISSSSFSDSHVILIPSSRVETTLSPNKEPVSTSSSIHQPQISSVFTTMQASMPRGLSSLAVKNASTPILQSSFKFSSSMPTSLQFPLTTASPPSTFGMFSSLISRTFSERSSSMTSSASFSPLSLVSNGLSTVATISSDASWMSRKTGSSSFSTESRSYSAFSSLISRTFSERSSSMTSSASFSPLSLVSNGLSTVATISSDASWMSRKTGSSSFSTEARSYSAFSMAKPSSASSWNVSRHASTNTIRLSVSSFSGLANPTSSMAVSPQSSYLPTKGVLSSSSVGPTSYPLQDSTLLSIQVSTPSSPLNSSFISPFSPSTVASQSASTATVMSPVFTVTFVQSKTDSINSPSSFTTSQSSVIVLAYSSLFSSPGAVRISSLLQSMQTSFVHPDSTRASVLSSVGEALTTSLVSTLPSKFPTTIIMSSQVLYASSMRFSDKASISTGSIDLATPVVTSSVHGKLSTSSRGVTRSETLFPASSSLSISSHDKGTSSLSDVMQKTSVAAVNTAKFKTLSSRSSVTSPLQSFAYHSSSVPPSRVTFSSSSGQQPSLMTVFSSSVRPQSTSFLPSQTARTTSLGHPTVATSPYNLSMFSTAVVPSTHAFSSSIAGPVTSFPDSAPGVVNSMGRIVAYVGRLLIYKIPYDTFYDREDGWTRNLTLLCRYLDGRSIDDSFWIHFDNTTQIISGLPFLSDYNSQGSVGVGIRIIAQDKRRNSARDVLNVYIENRAVELQFTISLRILRRYDEFLAKSTLKVALFNRTIAFFNASGADRYYGSSLVNGSVIFTWSDSTISGPVCNRTAIAATMARLVSFSGIDAAFAQWMYPQFPVLGVQLSYLGVCQSTSTPHVTVGPRAGTASNQDFVRYVVPTIAVAAVLAFIIGTVIFVSKRRRTKPSYFEKNTFKHGQPILLPEEYELDRFHQPNIAIPENYIPADATKEPEQTEVAEPGWRAESDDDDFYLDNPIYGLNAFSKPPPPYPRAASREASRRSSYESPYSRPPPAYQKPMPYVHPDLMTSEV